MKVLFDHGVPPPIRRVLRGHAVSLARDMGWETLRNGELLSRAEQEGFEVLLTTDKNMRYQQNLVQRKIALVVLANSHWPTVKRYLDRVGDAVDRSTPGSYVEVEIPYISSEQ